MPAPNMLRPLSRWTPSPLDALVEIAGGLTTDMAGVLNGLPGDNLDDWDPEYIARTLPLLRATWGNYFRGEVQGLENIPADGPCLLVGNHSGGLMIADTFVLTHEFYDHFGPERRFHQLAHDMAARNPLLGVLRRYGTVAASHENARRVFNAGAPLLVYPGGDYETFRPSWHSDRIEFGGRQGFIRLALEHDVPIVPVVSIGGQETALFLTRGESVARAVGLDRVARIKVLPVSLGPPFGITLLDLPGRIPLPAKIKVQVLEPIDLRERYGARPDPERVYEGVTGMMQDELAQLADDRALPVLG